MHKLTTESIQSGSEHLLLSSPFKSNIVKTWENLLQASFSISMSSEELLPRLDNFLESFIEDVHNQLDLSLRKAIDELKISLQKTGLSNTDLIEAILLFPHAIQSVENSLLQDFQGIKNSNKKSLSILANRVIASNLAFLFNLSKEAQKKSQERTAILLRVAKACSSSLNLEKVLQSISQEIIQALDAEALNSFLFTEPSKIGNYYLLNHFSPAGYKVPDPPEHFTLEALQRGIPITCYDAALDPRTDKKP